MATPVRRVKALTRLVAKHNKIDTNGIPNAFSNRVKKKALKSVAQGKYRKDRQPILAARKEVADKIRKLRGYPWNRGAKLSADTKKSAKKSGGYWTP